MTYGSFGFFAAGNYFGVSYERGMAPQWTDEAAATLQIIGVFVSIKFLWDIRHPKTE